MSKEYVAKIIFDTNNANLSVDKTNKKVKDLGKSAKEVGKTGSKSISGLNDSLSALPAPIQRIVGGFKTLKVALLSSGIGAFVVAAGALAGLFTAATKKGAEFNKAMSGLKAVTGATNQEMKALAGSAKELGSSTEFTAMQVAELQTELAKLGFSTQEILDMSEATLNLASSMGVSLDAAASFTGSTLRAFGLDASDSKEAIDILALSTTKSALDFNKLNTALTTVAPIAKTANVSLSETTAMLGTLSNAGFDASTSGTALRNIFLTLSEKGLTMEEAFSQINNAVDKNVVALDLFDKRGAGVAITLAENSGATQQLITDLNGASDAFGGLGAAAQIAETRLDNLEGDTTKLGSAWEGFLLSVEDGEGIFNKIARGFVQFLTKFVTRITQNGKALGALFSELNETVQIEVMQMRLGIRKFFTNISSFALKFKEAIADVPFIGKAIDKNKLAKDRKAITDELTKIGVESEYWANLEKQKAEEGGFLIRVAKRIAANEEILLAKQVAEEKIKNNDTVIESQEEEEKKTRDLIKLKQEELKLIQDTEAKTRDEIAARNDKVKAIQDEIKELQNLRTAKFAIEKIDFDSLPKLQKREAQKIEVRTGTEDLVARHIKKVNRALTRDDVIRIDEAHQRRIAEANARIDIASNALGSIGQLADAFARGDEERAKKAFKINKAVGIAQATISTAQGIMNELSHPVKTLTFTNYAAAAAMALAGAAQIATIATTKFNSGSSVKPTTTDNTGGGSLNAATQPPSFNVVGQSGFNQIAGALGQQPPTQAFVVAGDVTTAQQLQNNTITQATF
jgi:hypothetical protein